MWGSVALHAKKAADGRRQVVRLNPEAFSRVRGESGGPSAGALAEFW